MSNVRSDVSLTFSFSKFITFLGNRILSPLLLLVDVGVLCLLRSSHLVKSGLHHSAFIDFTFSGFLRDVLDVIPMVQLVGQENSLERVNFLEVNKVRASDNFLNRCSVVLSEAI